MSVTEIISPPTLTKDIALFLDFDGTLAPIQDDPESVHISQAQHDLLIDLSQALDGALAPPPTYTTLRTGHTAGER